MNSETELTLCNFIETDLSAIYEADPELTDGICIIALDNAIIALKQHYGFARNETVLQRPLIDLIVTSIVDIGVECIETMDDVVLKDFVAVVTKIRKSVQRHSAFGPRAYYDFVKKYV